MQYFLNHFVIALSLIATLFWVFQIIFALLFLRKRQPPDVDPPQVSVVIPVFNEDPYLVNVTIQSVLQQKNASVEIILVDDGSDRPFAVPESEQVKLIRLTNNRGKRTAQTIAARQAKYDWIATVDSDTVLQENSIYEIYKTAITENAHAVGGNIYLENENETLLTKIVACMYWFSFFQERASQAFFGQVTCCSGAFSLYKTEVFLKYEQEYLTQTFLSHKCRAGDDRHMTSLILLDQGNVAWSRKAVAHTQSPTTLINFAKQQIRWTRSHVAEIFFLFGRMKNWRLISTLMNFKLWFRHLYMLVIYVVMTVGCIHSQTIYPFIAVLLSIMIVTIIKILIAYFYTRQVKFFYLTLYSMFGFFILNPILFYGVITPLRNGWLTRKHHPV